jgi:hypothetical protein
MADFTPISGHDDARFDRSARESRQSLIRKPVGQHYNVPAAWTSTYMQ